ncbi:MAG TPA: sigma-70 family RNA polymerase sigma factor [Saprospiraceae bacterium]|nr:sigma-70 family RNA polymerase sigma factor [Saprospiraceae bacterium]
MQNESNPLSDKQLVGAVLSGNTQDFAVIIKNTERLVTQIIRRMAVNEEDQKDLVQDIYIRTYQNLSSFKFQSKLSTWVATIAYNTTINYLNKNRIRWLNFDKEAETIITLGENVEDEMSRKETALMVYHELSKLPPLYKTLISLYHIEELPNKEIAEITQLPEGTIKSYLYRARKILKCNIEKNYKKNPYEQ